MGGVLAGVDGVCAKENLLPLEQANLP